MNFTCKHVTFRAAAAFIKTHHRHHAPPQGGIVCVALWRGSDMVGVAVLGRPVARMAEDGNTVEVTRLCVLPEVRHAASALLARARRVAQALGYTKVLTYTLPEEGGASLRAVGAEQQGAAGGGNWGRPSRPRAPARVPQRKVRWSMTKPVPPLHVPGPDSLL